MREDPSAAGDRSLALAWASRVFVPVDRPEIVEAVLRRHPVQAVLDGAAA